MPRSLCRRKILPLVVLSIVTGVSFLAHASFAGEKPLPNVVLIVVDTLRADAIIGETGEVLYPSLRELAEDGVVFESCFSHAPMTLPSHAALFSSRLPCESGVLKNGDEVPEDLPLLAEHLRGQGYATAAATSISVFRARNKNNLKRGFDAVYQSPGPINWAEQTMPRLEQAIEELPTDRPAFLFAHYADPHFPYRAHGLTQSEARVTLDGQELATVSTSMSELWTDRIQLEPGEHVFEFESEDKIDVRWFSAKSGRAAIDYDFEVGECKGGKRDSIAIRVEGDREVPVNLQICIADVPGKGEHAKRYGREVGYVDRYIGRLLDDLRARGLYDTSLIVFTSDHGEGLLEHGVLGHSKNVYDELLHVPLIVKLPEGYDDAEEALRARTDRLVRHIDLAPTILDIAGLPPLDGQGGVTLLEDAERVLVAEAHKPFADEDLLCIRDEELKLIFAPETDRFEMYDLGTDPDEAVDRFGELGESRAPWQAMLRSMAALALQRGQHGELDADVSSQLAALGYVAN